MAVKHSNKRINNHKQSQNADRKYSKNKSKAHDYGTKTNQKSNLFYLLPIIFIIAILPLIVRLKDLTTPLSQYPWHSYDNHYTDFFLYYKQWFFISAVVIMLIIIIVKAYLDRNLLKLLPIFVPLAIYGILALLSSLFTEYREISLAGIRGQHESVFVLLGYCIIVYYVYLFVQTEEDVKLILNSLLASIIVLGVLGLTQYLGHDFFATNFGKKLITPSIYWNSLDSLQFTMGENRVYLTLYNPNYVGVYASLVVPLLLLLTVFCKKIWLIPVYLLAIAGMFIGLLGSLSTAGILAIIVAMIFTLMILWRYLVNYFYLSIPIILAIVCSFLLINKATDNYLIKQFDELTDIQRTNNNLTDIKTLDHELEITYKGNSLKAIFHVDEEYGICNFEFYDDANEPISSSMETINGPVTILDERFPEFVFAPVRYDDLFAFEVTIDNYKWIFTNQLEDGSYYYINRYGKYDKIITAPSALFTGYEKYASGRGYIWSRTIPLLKDNIFLGAGADTYALEFPQQDYVNRYNYGYIDQLLTKPHSLYLQIGVQTGVLSLIAFLTFYGMYLVSSIALYIRGRFKSYYAKVGIAILAGTFGYMISGITNDSTITVAPVFWILVGLGIVVNYKAKPYILQEAAEAKELKKSRKNLNKDIESVEL